jgi:3'-5' exoribonuclease
MCNKRRNQVAIQDLKEGMSVSMHALVVEKKNAVAKNGKPYADVVVSDKTGKLKCKIWNYMDESIFIVVGKPILMDVDIGSYNGELQGVIKAYQASDMEISQLVKSTRFNVATMYADIEEAIGAFQEPLTKFVAQELLKKYGVAFKTAPAATGVHNAWVGGLLEHVWSMCCMAGPIIGNYKSNYGVKLSTDKVYFGLIFHDIGKIEEYDIYNPAFPKSPDGILVNHLVLGPSLVWEHANKWYEEHESTMTASEFTRERNHLMHVLAAHHGTLEWGSPVQPSTIEAILVHQIDLLDSRVMHALELVEGKEGPVKGFSEKSWVQRTQFMK